VFVDRFAIHGSFLAGGQVATDGCLVMSHGIISDNPFGVNVQVQNFDYEKLTDDVVFRDNGMNIAARELPVPPPPMLTLLE
jgi:hypothetical protein